MKTVAFGCDHAGFSLRESVLEYLTRQEWNILDFGTVSTGSVDYPDYAVKVAEAVKTGRAQFGILICGTGQGMAITANKISGIRAACVSDCFSAKMVRAHNDAHIITLGSRVIGPGLAISVLEAFLTTCFEGGRHRNRLEKITSLEVGNITEPLC